jgi:hypothetical protein
LEFLLFCVLAAAGLTVALLVARSRPTPEAVAHGIAWPASAPILHLPGDGAHETPVAGASVYQDVLAEIVGGKSPDGVEFECVATLARDRGNAQDPNAVRVLIAGRQVGWIRRTFAASLAQVMDGRGLSRVTCDALVVGGWRRGGDEGHFGVRLDVLDDED